MRLPAFVCLSVCLLPRLLKNACMYLDEMSRVDRYRDMDDRIICLGSRLKLWQIKMNGVSQRNPIRMKSKRTNRISRKQNPNSYRTLIVTLILYNTSEFHKNESSVLTVFFLLFRIDSVDYSSEFDLSRKQPGVISARKPEARMAQSAGDVLGEGGAASPLPPARRSGEHCALPGRPELLGYFVVHAGNTYYRSRPLDQNFRSLVRGSSSTSGN